MMKLTLALLLLLLPLQVTADQVSEKSDCKHIYVKLGEHTFAIPAKGRSYLTYNGKEVKSPYCHHSLDQALTVNEFSFMLRKIVPGVTARQIIVDQSKDYEDGFIRIKKEMEQEGLMLADLPIKNGFRIYKKHYFITEQTDSLTPSGNPMLFDCGSDCNTIFLWKDNIRIILRSIDQAILQNANVKKFKDGIIKYLEQLEISPQQTKGD